MMKDSKTFVGTVACSVALGQWMINYVDAKHKAGIDKIAAMEQKVTGIEQREYRSQVMLRSIQASLDQVADRSRVMDQRIWELYRDSKRSKMDDTYSINQEE